MRATTLLTALLLSLPLPALAEGPLESSMTAWRVVIDNGAERYEEAKAADPGDVIEYRIAYSNVSDRTLSGIIVTGPVPNSTDYVALTHTASAPSQFEVTIDDGATWSAPPVYRDEIDPDGTIRLVEASPDEYDSVRWRPLSALGAGEGWTFSYRVEVE